MLKEVKLFLNFTKMCKKYIIVVGMLFSAICFAQQDAQYTQYMYNTISVNPAYAGSRGVFSLGGLYRAQWAGFEGAPVTKTLTFDSPIAKNIGLGVSIVDDEIGPSNETYFFIDFSYTIKTSDKYNLALGLKAGGNLLNVDLASLQGSASDPKFQNDIDNKFSPNIGAGAFFYSDKFYLGLSAPSLLTTKHFDESTIDDNTGQPISYLAAERTNVYAIMGYVFQLSPITKLKPATLIKAVQGAPLQIDLSANFLFVDKFRIGLGYRWDAAISGLAGFQVSKGLLIGYAYDAETTGLANYSSGSHEVFLRYELFKERGKTISPRFF